MSQQLTTGFSRRIASIATAGAIAFGGVALMAPTAAADDFERTPNEVIEQIEAQSWPVYSVDQPGPSVDIEFFLYFLNDLGYITQNPGQEFTEEVEATVLAFEEGEGIDVDGVHDSQNWIKIRNMHFPTEADAYQLGDRGHAIIGIQVLLNEKFDAGLDVTGHYNEATEDAVSEAQEEIGIGVDGAFGWLSYKGVVTFQDEGGRADSAQTPTEEAPVEEAPAEQAPAEGAEIAEDVEAAEDTDAAEGVEAAEDAERAEELDGARGY